MDEKDRLLELKKKFLFSGENNVLNKNINSLNEYLDILSCEDEDEIEKIILEIMNKDIQDEFID